MIAVISGNSSGFSSLDLGDVDNQGAGRVLYDNGDNYMRLDTNGSEKVRIKSDGNVGIGTTSPANNLQISSLAGVQTTPNQISIGSSFTGDNPAGANYKLKIYDAGGNSVNGITSTTSGMTYGVIAGGDHIFMGGNAGNSGTERMRITAGGSVGIGTVSPSHTLTITNSGTGDFNDVFSVLTPNVANGSHSGAVLFGQADSSRKSAHVSFVGNATAGQEHMAFGIWGADDLMVLKGNGNLGIGTTTPSEKLEVSGNVKATNINATGKIKEGGNDLLPAGTLIMWAGSISGIPAGWVLCNGQSLSKTTYPLLFSAIGYGFGGSGDNFNVPDLRDRFIVGAGSGYSVGGTGGSASISLSIDQLPTHNHTLTTDGSHTHTLVGGANVEAPGGYITTKSFGNGTISDMCNSSGSHTHTIGNTGSGSSIENRPPYYALCFIMKL